MDNRFVMSAPDSWTVTLLLRLCFKFLGWKARPELCRYHFRSRGFAKPVYRLKQPSGPVPLGKSCHVSAEGNCQPVCDLLLVHPCFLSRLTGQFDIPRVCHAGHPTRSSIARITDGACSYPYHSRSSPMATCRKDLACPSSWTTSRAAPLFCQTRLSRLSRLSLLLLSPSLQSAVLDRHMTDPNCACHGFVSLVYTKLTQ
jgi:hypothetical protein